MKILWVCNVLPPIIAEKLNMQGSNKEGWITGALLRMLENPSFEESKIELSIAFPVNDKANQSSYFVSLKDDFSVSCYSYYEDFLRPQDYCLDMESRFYEIIDLCKPEIIHVFGTEFGHTLAISRVVDKLKNRNIDNLLPKLLVGLQGIISKCGEEYNCELPNEVVNSRTIRDILKKDNISEQQAKFLERGEREIEALKLVDNVTGRTHFDYEFALNINPNVKYYHMNETLREGFYYDTWDVTSCDKHSIFVSQADYPLKGFHILLEAMPSILEAFPDAHIRVAGANIIAYESIKEKIKIGGYGSYLRKIISAYHLEGKVSFLGRLNEEQMKKEYLKCHTYVCPSSLENSPNSMGEAMLLGVPVIASRTGGIPSMINEEEEGLLFEVGNSEGLAADIVRIWMDDAYASELGAHGMNRARQTHNPDRNYERLLEIYGIILKQ